MSLILSRLIMSLLLLFALYPSPNAGRDAGGIYSAVPLAVRSPYLNCWHHDNKNASIAYLVRHGRRPSIILRFAIPVYLAGHNILTVNASEPRVVCPHTCRRLTYSFLGDVNPNLANGTVNLNSTFFAIGPTYTQLSGNAGPMQVILRFLNPIEVCCHSFVTSMSTYGPSEARRLGQAIHPYMSFTANSSEGASHHVQVYSDVSGGTSNRSPKRVVSPQLRYRVELGGLNATDSMVSDDQ
jgi:hypothetical protein